jgi:hypothetical protein
VGDAGSHGGEEEEEIGLLPEDQRQLVKKGDAVKASMLVNSPFTLEELVHMNDVFVNSKYGADLEGITCTLADSVCRSVESLSLEFKQESKKMPRQIRSMVQQILGEARDKWDTESSGASAATPNLEVTNSQGIPGIAGGVGSRPGVVNPNLQEPYYKAHA